MPSVAEEKLGTASSLIPVVYYDLIARVSSGAVLVSMFLFFNNIEPGGDYPNWTMALFMLVATYLGGYLLTTISAMINLVIWRPSLLRFLIDHLSLRQPLPTSSGRIAFAEIYRRIDYLGKLRGGEEPILVKMEASAALADNLFAAYVLVLVSVDGAQDLALQKPIAVVLVGLLLLGTLIFRRSLLVARQDELYDLEVSGRVDTVRPGEDQPTGCE